MLHLFTSFLIPADGAGGFSWGRDMAVKQISELKETDSFSDMFQSTMVNSVGTEQSHHYQKTYNQLKKFESKFEKEHENISIVKYMGLNSLITSVDDVKKILEHRKTEENNTARYHGLTDRYPLGLGKIAQWYQRMFNGTDYKSAELMEYIKARGKLINLLTNLKASDDQITRVNSTATDIDDQAKGTGLSGNFKDMLHNVSQDLQKNKQVIAATLHAEANTKKRGIKRLIEVGDVIQKGIERGINKGAEIIDSTEKEMDKMKKSAKHAGKKLFDKTFGNKTESNSEKKTTTSETKLKTKTSGFEQAKRENYENLKGRSGNSYATTQSNTMGAKLEELSKNAEKLNEVAGKGLFGRGGSR